MGFMRALAIVPLTPVLVLPVAVIFEQPMLHAMELPISQLTAASG